MCNLVGCTCNSVGLPSMLYGVIDPSSSASRVPGKFDYNKAYKLKFTVNMYDVSFPKVSRTTDI